MKEGGGHGPFKTIPQTFSGVM